MIARLDSATVFRRRSVTSTLTGEAVKKLGQACTSFSSILVFFLDSENLFFLSLIN